MWLLGKMYKKGWEHCSGHSRTGLLNQSLQSLSMLRLVLMIWLIHHVSSITSGPLFFFSHLLSIIFFFFPPFSWLEFQWVICFLLDGKLPARSVSDEGLEFSRTYGKDKTDKLFSKYKAFCGKVRTVADLDTHCLLQS